MGYIIKPLVTEKMTGLTEKSSEDKKISTGNKKTVETKGAQEETRSYTVKKKDGKSEKKSKTVYTYTLYIYGVENSFSAESQNYFLTALTFVK